MISYAKLLSLIALRSYPLNMDKMIWRRKSTGSSAACMLWIKARHTGVCPIWFFFFLKPWYIYFSSFWCRRFPLIKNSALSESPCPSLQKSVKHISGQNIAGVGNGEQWSGKAFSESLNAHKQNTSATKSAIMSALILRDKSVLERHKTRNKVQREWDGRRYCVCLHLWRNSLCVLVYT